MKHIKIFIITLFIMLSGTVFQAKAGDPLYKGTKIVSSLEQGQQTLSKLEQLKQRIEQLKASVMEYVEKGKSLIEKGENLFTEEGLKGLISDLSGSLKGEGDKAQEGSSVNKEEAAYEDAIKEKDSEKLSETILSTITYTNVLDAEKNIQYLNEYMQHYAASLYTDALLTRYSLSAAKDSQKNDEEESSSNLSVPDTSSAGELTAKMQIDKLNYDITSDIAKRLSRIVVMQARLNHAEQMWLFKNLSKNTNVTEDEQAEGE